MLDESIDRLQSTLAPILLQTLNDRIGQGISLSVFDKDDIFLSLDYGYRDCTQIQIFDENTLVPFGSTAKTITSHLVIKLVMEGVLDVEESINDYLPLKLDNTNEIKIKHLLNHTSGIGDLGVAMSQLSRVINRDLGYPVYNIISWDHFFDHLEKHQHRFQPPGVSYNYSDEAYMLCDYIITQATGKSFEKNVKEKIFNPIKMNRSTYTEGSYLQDPNHSEGYIIIPHESEILPVQFPFERLVYGAGGILSSTNEMGKFVQTSMNAANGVDKMFDQLMVTEHGWGSSPFMGYTFYGQAGHNLGGEVYIGFFEELQLGFAVATNCLKLFKSQIPVKSIAECLVNV